MDFDRGDWLDDLLSPKRAPANVDARSLGGIDPSALEGASALLPFFPNIHISDFVGTCINVRKSRHAEQTEKDYH